MRARGERPKETLETPSDVSTPGSSRLMAEMPSMVSTAESIHSSSPVASVNVSASKIRSSGARPYSSTQMSWILRATRTFSSRVLAMPASSMVSATTAAPCSTASGT